MTHEPAPTATAEALRQIIHGADFYDPANTLADLTAEQATTVPSGLPYSIATQVAHTIFWQDAWLSRIEGAPFVPFQVGKTDSAIDVPNRWDEIRARFDWPTPDLGAWNDLRAHFNRGLERAYEKALDASDLDRKTDGLTVGQMLLEIAIHASYHIGQIALIRRVMGIWPPAGVEDD